jgi:Myb-like DNA-binding domain
LSRIVAISIADSDGVQDDIYSETGVVQYPATYTETEHHLSQSNLHQPHPFIDPSPGNAFVPFGTHVPTPSFVGMDSTSQVWQAKPMADFVSSTNDSSSSQSAGITIPNASQISARKKCAPKAVSFRQYKPRNRRSQKPSTPDMGSLLGKKTRLRVTPLDIQIPSHDGSAGRESVLSGGTLVTDLHHIEQQQGIALLKKSFRPSSAFSAQKFADLMTQIEQLVLDNQKYLDPTTHIAGTGPTSTISSTIDSYSNSGVVDSEYLTDNTSVSSTPCPQFHDAQDSSPSEGRVERKHRHCAKCGVKPLFYCTRKKCGYSTHTFTDWKRHEEGEKHWPQERFMCLECPTVPPPTDVTGRPLCEFCDRPFGLGEVPRAHYLRCTSARRDSTTFSRKDHLIQHLRGEHGLTYTNLHISNWAYSIDSRWPRQCGFCDTEFTTWDQRMRHIAEHFEEGRDMSDWKWPQARPKDSHPRMPHKRPQDDDSDSGDDFDGSNGGAGRKAATGKRNKMSSIAQTQGRVQRGGTQSTTSNARGHSNHIQRKESTPEVQHHNIASPLGQPRPSVALEMYLNDPYEPIGALLDSFRPETLFHQSSGPHMETTCRYNDDWAKGLKTEPGGVQQTKQINDLCCSQSPVLSVKEKTPCQDLESTATALERSSIDRSKTFEIDGVKTDTPAYHGPLSPVHTFKRTFADVKYSFLKLTSKFEAIHPKAAELKEAHARHIHTEPCSIAWIDDLITMLFGSSHITDFDRHNFLTQRAGKITPDDACGETPLYLAALAGDFKKVQFLINNGAKLQPEQSVHEANVHLAAVQASDLQLPTLLFAKLKDLQWNQSIWDTNIQPTVGTDCGGLFRDPGSHYASSSFRIFSDDLKFYEPTDRVVTTDPEGDVYSLDEVMLSMDEYHDGHVAKRDLVRPHPIPLTRSGNQKLQALARLALLHDTSTLLNRIHDAKVNHIGYKGLTDASTWQVSPGLQTLGQNSVRRKFLYTEHRSEEMRLEDLRQDSRVDTPKHGMTSQHLQETSPTMGRTFYRRGPGFQAVIAYLLQLIHVQGALNWIRIAQLMASRSPKQCRERYRQILKPSLNHEPISSEEGLQIERMVGQIGKWWAEIARTLHGRSDNSVNNRYPNLELPHITIQLPVYKEGLGRYVL